MSSHAVTFTREKILLICEHIESLCKQSARLMEAGEAAALASLQERKAAILAELRQGLVWLNSTADAFFRDAVAKRLQDALSQELRTVNAMMAAIQHQLMEQAAGELRLAKIRKGYGVYAKPEETVHDLSISACG